MHLREREEVQVVLRRGGLRSSRFALGALGLVVDLVYLLAAPFVFLYWLVASRCFTRPKYRRGLLAKLGARPARPGREPSLWLHAVSVGEVLTAAPLMRALASRFPACPLRISTSTFTGMDVARQRFGDDAFYAPVDFSPVVGRAFRLERPAAVVLLELELWPNFLLGARRRGVPVLVANGRLTERSARRYARGGRLTAWFFNLVDAYAVQNEEYARRFRDLGVDPGKVQVLGNLKHDREPSVDPERGLALRRLLGWPEGETVVLTGGSTHPGEERSLCALHAELLARDPRRRLVLAPRHVERLTEAEVSGWGAQGPVIRWSTVRSAPAGVLKDQPGAILLVDTLGELELFYALADLVFVGGSLIPHGGHNLFEAARLARPILFGPWHRNFQEEADLLLQEGAAVLVRDAADLAAAVERLGGRPDEARRLGEKAFAVTDRLRGATARHVEWLERQLQLPPAGTPC